jgi:predicted lipid-binding transport protein (Tim44 family)
MSNPSSSQTPQFRTAEYAGEAGSDCCKFCNQTLMGSYFRVNQSMACGACVEKARQKIPVDNHAAFTRGLLFGVGGAIAGLILYAAVGIITGWMIGYVALAVGWIVGKAMMAGSGGIGGRRYQIAAVALTYAAVSIAAIPIFVAQESKAHRAAQTEPPQTVRPPDQPRVGNAASSPEPTPPAAKSRPSLGAALVILVLIGLASPFLALSSPLQGLIGLVILFVGIQFAWKMTRGVSVQILGPFKLA